MASIRELEDTIRACRERISLIEDDIEGMETGKTNMSTFKTNFTDQKDDIDTYDISNNSIDGNPENLLKSIHGALSGREFVWQGNLYDTASERKDRVSSELGALVDACQNTIDELDVCIGNAQDEIDKLNQQISDCEDEIERIKAEEEAAASSSSS